jgi:hypothetical protein
VGELKELLGRDAPLHAALMASYELMHTSVAAPLELGALGVPTTYAAADQAARDADVAAAKVAAAAAGSAAGTVQRPAGVRAFLDSRKVGYELSANVPGYAWPQSVKKPLKPFVRWCLAEHTGSRGRAFTVAELEAALKPSLKRKEKREAGKRAAEAVAFLLERQLLAPSQATPKQEL